MKSVLLAAVFSFFLLKCFSQVSEINKIYNRIDTLKQRLPTLKDTARINCLDSIAIGMAFGGNYKYYDSVGWYALPALKESRTINYKRGMYSALYALGVNETRSDLHQSELHLRELINISVDDSVISMARTSLGQTLMVQARFEEAINMLSEAAKYYQKEQKLYGLQANYGGMTECYVYLGNLEKAFEYARLFFEASKVSKSWVLQVQSRIEMADMYMKLADYATAKKYLADASSFLPQTSRLPQWVFRSLLSHYADLYLNLNQFDSAFTCYQQASVTYPTAVLWKLRFGKVYLAQKNYNKAILLLDSARVITEKKGDKINFMQSLVELGRANLETGNYTKSLTYLKSALRLGLETRAKQIVADSYLTLYQVNESLGNSRLALNYYKQYILLKDSLITDRFRAKLADYKQIADGELKLAELKKEKQISEQEAKVQQEHLRQKILFKNFLIGGMILVILLSWFIVRGIFLKRKNELLQNQQIQSQLQHKASQLEMRALRAQMNPHFIFNCLTSINRFILKNETEAASDYLTKFSRLMRMVLTHSQSSMITLRDELEMLRLYLDMEQLRFKQAFDYSITYCNAIDAEMISVPPLLLQPFCENAIWHGLMQKDGQGHLKIDLKLDTDSLLCTITDDGIGRKKAAELKTKSLEKRKSLGLKITTERLALFNHEKSVHTSYHIEDLFNSEGNACGTKVILRIHHRQQVPEVV